MAARARIFDFDRVDQLLSEAEPLPRRGSVLRASSHLITVDLPGGQQQRIDGPIDARRVITLHR